MKSLKFILLTFSLIFVLSVFSLSAAENLTLCYKAYYFVPLGEACIEYLLEENYMKIESYLKTNTFASMLKKIDDRGFSTFESKKFEFQFYQKEGGYVRDHLYSYDNKSMSYNIIRYKKDKQSFKKGILENDGLLDPYFYTLNIQCGFKRSFKLFYDEKKYDIPVENRGGEKEKIVSLKPEIKTNGLLVPKGNWTFYIDDYGIFTDLFVEFTIGKAKLKMISIEGDKGVVKKMCKIFE